jgi:hypothetical protein
VQAPHPRAQQQQQQGEGPQQVLRPTGSLQQETVPVLTAAASHRGAQQRTVLLL